MLAPGGVRAFSGRRHLVRSRRHARGGPVRLGGLPLRGRRDAGRPDLPHQSRPGPERPRRQRLEVRGHAGGRQPARQQPAVGAVRSARREPRRRAHDLVGDRVRAGGGEDRVDDHHRPARCHDRGARFGHQVERRERDGRPADEGAPEPRRAAHAEPRRRRARLGCRLRRLRERGRRQRRWRVQPAGLRVRRAHPSRRRAPRRPGEHARPTGPPDRLLGRRGRRGQRLRRRHRRLGLPRQRQRPLRRRPVRPRDGRGARLHGRGEQRRRRRELPQLRGRPPARGRFVRRRREPVRPGHALRRRQRGARHPGGAGHAELLQARARRRRLRLRARRDGDGVGGGRGGAAPQLAVVAAPRDRRELGAQPRRGHPVAEVLPALQRVHELLVEDLARHPEHELLLERRRPRRRDGRPRLQRGAQRARGVAEPAGRQRLLPPDRRERVHDHPQRGRPADGGGEGREHAAGGRRQLRQRQRRQRTRLRRADARAAAVHGPQQPGAPGARRRRPSGAPRAGRHARLPGPEGARPVLRLRAREHVERRPRGGRRRRPARGLDRIARLVRPGRPRSGRPRPPRSRRRPRRGLHMPCARGPRLLSQRRHGPRRRLRGRPLPRRVRRLVAHRGDRRDAGARLRRHPEVAVPGDGERLRGPGVRPRPTRRRRTAGRTSTSTASP